MLRWLSSTYGDGQEATVPINVSKMRKNRNFPAFKALNLFIFFLFCFCFVLLLVFFFCFCFCFCFLFVCLFVCICLFVCCCCCFFLSSSLRKYMFCVYRAYTYTMILAPKKWQIWGLCPWPPPRGSAPGTWVYFVPLTIYHYPSPVLHSLSKTVGHWIPANCFFNQKWINCRLITAYLLLRVNLDKIMHALWNFDASSKRTWRVSALNKHQNWSASALFCLNSRAQSKYTIVNLIHTQRKQTFLSFICDE